MVIIARCKDDVGISAIDFFSFGHIIAGYMTFLIIFNIFCGIYGFPLNFYYLYYIFILGIVWELIENFFLFKIHIKFAQRRDSKINSLMDIAFLVSGGFFAYIILFFDISLLFIGTLTIFYGVPIIMSINARKILRKKKKDL